ncbi:type IV secretory system conjugative DNA transfer family protein [Bradyrhizobium sp. CCBAU 65884]|nr:type IV secretory system conjugative DNA transfer family protein [Bradyrhizobium sp. CCBAU 65884]
MGAGKGIGVVIPNLFDYCGSVVCTDIKGENSAITRRRRAS